MRLLYIDANGTNGQDLSKALAVYQVDGQLIAIPANTDAANVDAAVLAKLTDQQPEVAQQFRLIRAKDYLRTQLMSASPNVTTIYNTVKAAVDADAVFSQMVANQITLMSTSFTWVLNLITPTATDRMRYLMAVEMVISLIG